MQILKPRWLKLDIMCTQDIWLSCKDIQASKLDARALLSSKKMVCSAVCCTSIRFSALHLQCPAFHIDIINDDIMNITISYMIFTHPSAVSPKQRCCLSNCSAARRTSLISDYNWSQTITFLPCFGFTDGFVDRLHLQYGAILCNYLSMNVVHFITQNIIIAIGPST